MVRGFRLIARVTEVIGETNQVGALQFESSLRLL
jgi:hypothetical protein